MKVLVIFLILLSFNSYSQLDTNKAIIGEWNLAYYKETSVMIDKESEFISTKNDSIIRLSINKETVKIFRKSYLSTDTFSFKYSIKSSNFKYGNQENNLILKLDKKTKKRVKRYYKNKLNEISFSIKKINNTQLAIENHSFDFHFINPLFYQSRKTYSFEKVNTVKDSLEKQFTGLWFSCENIESLKNIDTIQFTKDDAMAEMAPRGTTRLYDTAVEDIDKLLHNVKTFRDSLHPYVRKLNPTISMTWACCTDGQDNASISNFKRELFSVYSAGIISYSTYQEKLSSVGILGNVFLRSNINNT